MENNINFLNLLSLDISRSQSQSGQSGHTRQHKQLLVLRQLYFSAVFVYSGGALLSVVFVFCFNDSEEREEG